MPYNKLLEVIDNLHSNTLGIYAGAQLAEGLTEAIKACQDWENRGSYCIPIKEVIEAIEKGVSEN